MHTLRDGLLRATPTTSDGTQLACIPGVGMPEIVPFSLFLSITTGVSSSRCIGLEGGSGASLLGTGVNEGGGRVNDCLDRVGVDICFFGVG